MPTMMPLVVDKAHARDVSVAFGLAIKGGPRLAVVVDDGQVTVTRDAPSRGYDYRITVELTVFLLLCFRRMPLWRMVIRGRIRAGGRTPWLTLRLRQILVRP